MENIRSVEKSIIGISNDSFPSGMDLGGTKPNL